MEILFVPMLLFLYSSCLFNWKCALYLTSPGDILNSQASICRNFSRVSLPPIDYITNPLTICFLRVHLYISPAVLYPQKVLHKYFVLGYFFFQNVKKKKAELTLYLLEQYDQQFGNSIWNLFFFSFKDLYIHFEREREERAKRDRRRLQTKHKSYSERGFFHPEITI